MFGDETLVLFVNKLFKLISRLVQEVKGRGGGCKGSTSYTLVMRRSGIYRSVKVERMTVVLFLDIFCSGFPSARRGADR